MLALYISLLDTEEQISKFEHIYTKYRGLMFYTAKGVLQDSYLAEDAVHETFLDIIRIIDRKGTIAISKSSDPSQSC